jgi:hypothetical protein
MTRWWLMAAALAGLAGCGATDGAPSFSVLESEGSYANPDDTPAGERRAAPPPGLGLIHLSPIPGESGFSSTSSVLGGSGGMGGGHGRR